MFHISPTLRPWQKKDPFSLSSFPPKPPQPSWGSPALKTQQHKPQENRTAPSLVDLCLDTLILSFFLKGVSEKDEQKRVEILNRVFKRKNLKSFCFSSFLERKVLNPLVLRSFSTSKGSFITSLDISGSRVSNYALSLVGEIRSLTTLSLRSCTNFDDGGLAALARGSCSKYLKNLDLSKCRKVSDAAITVLTSFENLRLLDLSDLLLTDAGISELRFGFLKLEFLSLSRTKITDESLEILSSSFGESDDPEKKDKKEATGLISLKNLKICSVAVTSKGLLYLTLFPSLALVDLFGTWPSSEEEEKFWKDFEVSLTKNRPGTSLHRSAGKLILMPPQIKEDRSEFEQKREWIFKCPVQDLWNIRRLIPLLEASRNPSSCGSFVPRKTVLISQGKPQSLNSPNITSFAGGGGPRNNPRLTFSTPQTNRFAAKFLPTATTTHPAEHHHPPHGGGGQGLRFTTPQISRHHQQQTSPRQPSPTSPQPVESSESGHHQQKPNLSPSKKTQEGGGGASEKENSSAQSTPFTFNRLCLVRQKSDEKNLSPKKKKTGPTTPAKRILSYDEETPENKKTRNSEDEDSIDDDDEVVLGPEDFPEGTYCPSCKQGNIKPQYFCLEDPDLCVRCAQKKGLCYICIRPTSRPSICLDCSRKPLAKRKCESCKIRGRVSNGNQMGFCDLCFPEITQSRERITRKKKISLPPILMKAPKKEEMRDNDELSGTDETSQNLQKSPIIVPAETEKSTTPPLRGISSFSGSISSGSVSQSQSPPRKRIKRLSKFEKIREQSLFSEGGSSSSQPSESSNGFPLRQPEKKKRKVSAESPVVIVRESPKLQRNKARLPRAPSIEMMDCGKEKQSLPSSQEEPRKGGKRLEVVIEKENKHQHQHHDDQLSLFQEQPMACKSVETKNQKNTPRRQQQRQQKQQQQKQQQPRAPPSPSVVPSPPPNTGSRLRRPTPRTPGGSQDALLQSALMRSRLEVDRMKRIQSYRETRLYCEDHASKKRKRTPSSSSQSTSTEDDEL